MKDENGFLERQVQAETEERLSRRRRQRAEAMRDGSYKRKFGSYAAGHGFVSAEITDEEKQVRRAERDKRRALNRTLKLPQDTPIPPPHLMHTNRKGHNHDTQMQSTHRHTE